MTIERIAQLTADDRVITNLASVGADFPDISSAQAHTGGYSYLHVAGNGPVGTRSPTALTALRVGFWVYMSSTGIGSNGIFYRAHNARGNLSGDSRIFLRHNSGNIELCRPNGVSNSAFEILATIALPAQFSTSGTWFHAGITHRIHETDGFLSMYVDGVRVLNHVGDTRLSRYESVIQYQTSAIGVFGAGSTTTSGGFTTMHSDDWYLDSYVGEADAPVPARRFLMVLPTGVGADDDWTPEPSADNYANVDDNPNDGDSTYVKALAADLRDTYAYGNISLPADHRIIAVLPSPFAKRLDTELDHKISVHAWDGSDYLDSAELDLSMSYDVPVFARFTVQPDTSAWDETDFNAMQFGAKSAGTF
jgi:hypothetical protein